MGQNNSGMTGCADGIPRLRNERGPLSGRSPFAYNNQLLRAMARRDEKTSMYLLQKPETDVNVVEQGITPLHLCLMQRNTEYITRLIEAGADVNIYEGVFLTPLMFVALQGRADLAQVLLQQGADVNFQWKGETGSPISNENASLRLLPMEAKEGETALHIAASRRHVTQDLVHVFSSHGADFNLQAASGSTPLHYLAKRDDSNLISHLISVPTCDLNIRNNSGCTALMEALFNGNTQTAMTLINANCDVNIKPDDRMQFTSPLMIAAQQGWSEIVDMLIQHGSDVNAICCHKKSALHYSIQQKDHRSASLLLKNGADLSLKDNRGNDCLMIAVEVGSVECFQLLLSHGASLDTVNKQDRGPLHLACHRGHVDIVRQLIDLGCDFEIKDGASRTPLHIAVYFKQFAIITLLVEANCQLNHQDSGGKTPLSLATKNHHLDITQYLLEKGANPDIPDDEGKCPLHYAVQFPSFFMEGIQVLMMNQCDAVNFVDFIDMLLREMVIMPGNDIMQMPFMQNWHMKEKRTPRRLKQLCRFAVQKYLRIFPRDNPVTVLESSNLPLPRSLIQYCSVKMF